ncbi:MAG: HAD family hydrolase [Chlorobi bacterium]|nr:HAD family hydrolase [Chlorobiota bacterium]MCI0716563.1 HAD family hydrolase [Chlorobiota bacterium]
MTAKEFIKDFEVLIFDMGKTIMFGGDRFDKEQNYEASYKKYGGKTLTNKELHEIIYYIYGTLLARSRTQEYLDNMITVKQFIESDSYFVKYSKDDKVILEKVFAHHECGVVPQECKDTLKELSEYYKLGLISNVWCESIYFKNKLKDEEIYDLFEIAVFSADYNIAKPSQKLFQMAIDHFNKPSHEIVYIGDNYKRDVVGSKNAGMKSILVQNSESSNITGQVKPDYIINSITELI